MQRRGEAIDVAAILARRAKGWAKKRGPTSSSVYNAIYPLFYVIRIFGLAPYEFSNNRLLPSNIYLLFTPIVMSIYFFVMYTMLLRFMGPTKDRPVLNRTEHAKMVFNFCTIMYDMTMTMLMRRKFTHIWNSMEYHDNFVRHLGFGRNETRTKMVAWFLLFLNFLLWTVVNQSGMYAFSESWTHNAAYMLPYVGSCTSVHKFAGVTLLFGQRFRHLNEIAKDTLPSKDGTSKSSKINVDVIRSLHNDLMIAVEELAALYSWSLLFWLTNLCIHSVSNLYIIISTLMFSWDKVCWAQFGCLSLWLVTSLLQLLLLHVACDFTTNEANGIGTILIDWEATKIDRMSLNHEIDTSMYLLNRRLKFSAAGCFYVDLPLLRSIAGALTTYLVICLQLQ